MKCFNVILVFIIGVTLGIISVSSRNIDSGTPNCVNEKEELLQQYDSCAPDQFQIFDIFNYVKQYRNDDINGTEFSRSITEYCDTLKSSASCGVEKATHISPVCRQISKIQSFVNLIRIATRVADDLCTESIILEIATDKGFNCLGERKLSNCLKGKASRLYFVEPMDDRSLCVVARHIRTCTNEILDECENDGFIKKYANQTLNGVIQDFSCA